ncbi:MAG: MFS transporter [Deltaproteobacteria bacterium]|jgi:MFS transporter, DHA1 family, multidrug resistance protein|nr:MFS transporter [Deltaproteobacteria bacterium]MBT4526027.1 MFS transporter [Deltaproteobacteria bacterium]
MISWKKNLIVIWMTQFLAISGFAFSMPFVPFYIQELGVKDGILINQYTAMFGALAPLTLAIFSPIWGMIGDHYGRRLMLLRANFGAAIILTLMGMVDSISWLLILRAIQGVFTGTMTASQTLVSVNTPEEKHGLALGSLSAAIFSGALFGTFIGGTFAELFGYRAAFYISGGLLLVSSFLVLFGVKEDFSPPQKSTIKTTKRADLKTFIKSIGPAVPILILLLFMSFTRQFDNVFLPLFVQEINGTIEGSAYITGVLGAIGGIAGFLAGIIMGRLSDRISPPKIAMISALFAGLFMLPQAVANSFAPIFMTRFGMIFFSGGLDPVLQVWLAKVTPHRLRGSVFGWAGSAKAIGWMFAPLSSGLVASYLNIRWIYWIGCALFLLLIPMIWMVVQYLRKHTIP